VIVQAEATLAASAEAEMIEGLGTRIEAWRRSENRGRAMPEELWEEASAAAQLLGVARVARTLGLSYDTLKRRAFPAGAVTPPSRTEFIELAGLSALGTSAVTEEAVVELSAADGAKLTVRLKGPSVAHVVALVQAVWSRGA
jgi:hypothetical protein